MRMKNIFQKYIHWLHLQWPSGKVENLPLVERDGSTNLPGVYVVGDLTGIPLLKFAGKTGKNAVHQVKKYLESNSSFKSRTQESDSELESNKIEILDLAIIGGGISGISSALEAEAESINYRLFEANRVFFTIHDFPKGKPIYLYPEDMNNDSPLHLAGDTKESLLENLESSVSSDSILQEKLIPKTVSYIQKTGKGTYSLHDEEGSVILTAESVIIGIGRNGEYRKLNIPGEDLPHVYKRLHDPGDFSGQNVTVVGGGDTALETAIALARSKAKVTLLHRGSDFAKAKPENSESFRNMVEQGSIQFHPESVPYEIRENSIHFRKKNPNTGNAEESAIKASAIFSMIGRSPSFEFFRKSGIPIFGEWPYSRILGLVAFLGFCVGMYHWKMDGSWIHEFFRSKSWFPFSLEAWRAGFHPDGGIMYILSTNLVSPSFYYSLTYTSLVGIFGWRRVAKRPTPYIRNQTLTLFMIQAIPLFFLPFFILPWMGYLGVWDSGMGSWIGNEFFPVVDYGLGREYWRAFGLILAWPLFIWNVFSGGPMWGWLTISFIQTFIIIPWIVWKYGKGGYCGWICSCGALAETFGDAHRKKMPHGPIWNRVNLIGQVILAFAFLLLALRLGSWFFPVAIGSHLQSFYNSLLAGWSPFSYYYIVDVWLAGILGVGLYFHFSGRTWCRFACPLAALMHIYARFSRFRIFSDKKKCISCNVCTSVCHQGIDVMAFANKGLPMEDPQCVRCSACVVNCPTQVLSFGHYDENQNIRLDKTRATL